MSRIQSFRSPVNHTPSRRTIVPTAQYGSIVERGEAAFDTAILNNDIVHARNVASNYMDVLATRTTRGIYPRGLSRLALKEVALPYFGRAMYDAFEAPYTEAQIGAAGVYKDSVLLLEYFKNWADGLAQWTVDGQDDVLKELRGGESELTILALTARKIHGLPEDSLTILPSTHLQDTDPKLDRRGKKRRFDFIVRQRAEQRVIPAQVKTSPWYGVGEYNPRILMISSVDLAGGRRENQQLQLALIADAHGNADPKQIELIENASAKLDELYGQHFHRFGSQAITAANM